MSLKETKSIDRIEVVDHGFLQVREATVVMRDDQEIARNYHRWCFAPGSDVSAFPANVQAIAQAAWTPEVVAAYQSMVAEQQAKMEAMK